MEDVKVSVGADLEPLRKGLKQGRDDLEGFKERAKSATAVELSLNLAKLKEQLAGLKAQLKTDIPSEVKISLTAQSEVLKREITQAGRELTNFLRTGEKDVSVLGKLFGDLGNNFGNSFASASSSLKDGLSSIGNSLKTAFSGDIKGAVTELKTGFSGLGQSAKAGIDGVTTSVGTLKTGMVELGISAVKAFAGFQLFQLVVGFFSEASAEGLKFLETLQGIKNVSEGTKEQYDALEESILKTSNATGKSSQELAKASENMAQAGVALNDIPGILDTVAKAAVVNGSSTEAVFTGLQATMKTYGIAVADTSKVSDLFFQANKQGSIDVENLANSIQSVAPIAETAGISLKEVVAGFATFTGVTGNADEVATQLKGSIQAIAAPSVEASVAARQLGIELGESAIKSKGYAGVIEDIYNKTGGNLDLIKKIIPEQRALTLVTSLGGKQVEQYAQNLEGLNNSLGATEEAFKGYSKSEVFLIKQSQTQWDNWKQGVGKNIDIFGAQLIWLGGKIGDLFKFIGKTIATFGLVIATGLTAIGETFINVGLFIFDNWKLLWVNIGKITYNAFKDLSAIFSNVGFNLGNMASNIVDIISGAFGDLPGFLATALNSALTKVTGFFAKAIEKYNQFVDFIGQGNLKVDAKFGGGGVEGGKTTKTASKSITQGNKDWTGGTVNILDGTKGFDTSSVNFDATKKMMDIVGKAIQETAGDYDSLTASTEQSTQAGKNNVGEIKKTAEEAKKTGVTLEQLKNKQTDLKNTLETSEIGSQAFKDAQKQLDAVGKQIDGIEGKKEKAGANAQKKAETLAKKELDAQKKSIEDKANLDIKAIQNSTVSETQKANEIVRINEKMKEDLSLLDGKYAQVQADNAEKVLKADKEALDARKKQNEDAYKALGDAQKQNISDVEKLADAYADLKDKLSDVTKKGAEDLKQLNEQIKELQKSVQDILDKGAMDLGKRGIEVAQELKDAQAQFSDPTQTRTPAEDTALRDKIFALQQEQKLVNDNTSQAQRDAALKESQKSKAQLIIDEIKANQQKAEQELIDAQTKKKATEDQLVLDKQVIQEKMDAIAIQITNESLLLIQQDTDRRKLEADYTKFFGEQIKARKDVMDELIAKTKEATIALQSAGITTTVQTNAGTNRDAQGAVVNVTNNSNVDADSFLRALNNLLPSK